MADSEEVGWGGGGAGVPSLHPPASFPTHLSLGQFLLLWHVGEACVRACARGGGHGTLGRRRVNASAVRCDMEGYGLTQGRKEMQHESKHGPELANKS